MMSTLLTCKQAKTLSIATTGLAHNNYILVHKLPKEKLLQPNEETLLSTPALLAMRVAFAQLSIPDSLL